VLEKYFSVFGRPWVAKLRCPLALHADHQKLAWDYQNMNHHTINIYL
jgi:hypothetical protein